MDASVRPRGDLGTPEQKKRWVKPLLAGELYSAFSRRAAALRKYGPQLEAAVAATRAKAAEAGSR